MITLPSDAVTEKAMFIAAKTAAASTDGWRSFSVVFSPGIFLWTALVRKLNAMVVYAIYGRS